MQVFSTHKHEFSLRKPYSEYVFAAAAIRGGA